MATIQWRPSVNALTTPQSCKIFEGNLLFTLLDMTENGEYSLNEFVGSILTGLDIRVNSFTQLVDMIRNSYSGRLVDVLDVRLSS
ncbi:MAG: hypothetical protein D3924_17045 [Candidatus Electrothrix sp. AR4]|nr:hypothetical protein [Candidatus Electrothrix sp. AR4]